MIQSDLLRGQLRVSHFSDATLNYCVADYDVKNQGHTYCH